MSLLFLVIKLFSYMSYIATPFKMPPPPLQLRHCSNGLVTESRLHHHKEDAWRLNSTKDLSQYAILVHAESVGIKRSPVRVMWKFGKELSAHAFRCHLTMI
ncbi:hypothetical protein AVEN_254710-1 [Araneus ventricosus]|uniref:Uncharacterized protein n=1 Tax=Araneus ventricosus TaxID=182803 RepID=A0A4Y2U5X3_ARAVE|nr:hypothetical protein AVEN_254710-1 [Araneus ventricosus]